MPNALELTGIRKSFDGFAALTDARFSARWGEVHALLGENGAGKSSLMNIAAGLYAPEAGQLLVDDNAVRFAGPRDAAKHRIGMVHQHFKLVRPFTVAQNILLTAPPPAEFQSHGERLREISRDIRNKAAGAGLRHRSLEARRCAVGRRAAARGNPQGAAGGRAHPDPRRAHGRADRPGGRAPAADGAGPGAQGRGGGARHAQDGRREDLRRPRDGDARRTHGGHAEAARSIGRRAGEAHGGRIDCRARLPALGGASWAGAPFGARAAHAGLARGPPRARRGGPRPACGRDLRPRRRGRQRTGRAGGRDHGPGRRTHRRRDAARRPWRPEDHARLGAPEHRHRGHSGRPLRARARGRPLGGRELRHRPRAHRPLRARVAPAARPHPGDTQEAVRAFDVQGVRSVAQKAALLSGGNAQKLVLAREFGKSPTLVLAHSPSAGSTCVPAPRCMRGCAPRATAARRCCSSAKTSTRCCSSPTAWA